jgi:MFS family permease
MIQQFFHRFFSHRHFWRYASFSEVAELYASRTMRLFALRMASVFIAIYLYQIGYSLTFIALFWATFYFVKVLFSWPAAQIAARRGPKRGMFISNVVSAISMALLIFVSDPVVGIYVLFAWCGLQAFSGTLNDLCYLIDFSKVKSMKHAGKEIGFMNIFEKVSNGLSPIVGGLLAFLAGPHVVMAVSAALFLLSSVPLMQTGERLKINHKLNFRHFPWRLTWRSFIAEAAVGYDVFVTGTAWSLFMTIAVFVAAKDENIIYAEVGAVTSIAMLASLLASYVCGKLIDRRRGRQLLITNALINSAVHISRPFITTPVGVVYTNIANEVATTGFGMAFLRGLFDTADRSHHRIEYLFIIEIVVNLGAGLAALLFGFLVFLFSDISAMQIFFVLSAFITLLIATPRFKLYAK